MRTANRTIAAHVLPLVLATAVVGSAGCGVPATAAPIAFSHPRHAALDIGCSYCHPTAATGAGAGMPAAAICRDCHRAPDSAAASAAASRVPALVPPGFWHRRCGLPPDVGFDHAAHAAGGIACASCHGPVERLDDGPAQPWSMRRCLACHLDDTLATAAEPARHCSGCHR